MEPLQDTNELEIAKFHEWISELCDPDSNIIQLYNERYFDLIKEEFHKKKSMNPLESEDGLEIILKYANKYNSYGEIVNTKGPFFIQPENSDAILEGILNKNGIPHGFCRVLSPDEDLDFYGCFVDGVLVGNCWKGLMGGSFMMSDNCEFIGENTVYLYPDCRTAIIGNFDDKSHLRSGQVTEIISVEKDQAFNPEPVFLAPDSNGPVFEYDLSTETSISKTPLERDPYEELFVYVDESTIPNAEEGLFAKIDIEEGTVISFYNGVRSDIIDPDDKIWRNWPYKIALDEFWHLDIPEGLRTTDKYQATLGHKVCHSFEPNCEFDNFEHPRFGPIMCLVALTSIDEGEELLANYKYDLKVAPEWYVDLWNQHYKDSS